MPAAAPAAAVTAAAAAAATAAAAASARAAAAAAAARATAAAVAHSSNQQQAAAAVAEAAAAAVTMTSNMRSVFDCTYNVGIVSCIIHIMLVLNNACNSQDFTYHRSWAFCYFCNLALGRGLEHPLGSLASPLCWEHLGSGRRFRATARLLASRWCWGGRSQRRSPLVSRSWDMAADPP